MEVDDLSPAVTGSAIPTVPSAVAKKKASTQVWPLTFMDFGYKQYVASILFLLNKDVKKRPA